MWLFFQCLKAKKKFGNEEKSKKIFFSKSKVHHELLHLLLLCGPGHHGRHGPPRWRDCGQGSRRAQQAGVSERDVPIKIKYLELYRALASFALTEYYYIWAKTHSIKIVLTILKTFFFVSHDEQVRSWMFQRMQRKPSLLRILWIFPSVLPMMANPWGVETKTMHAVLPGKVC